MVGGAGGVVARTLATSKPALLRFGRAFALPFPASGTTGRLQPVGAGFNRPKAGVPKRGSPRWGGNVRLKADATELENRFGRFWMEQRQLRLGDILDDYCPRERRLTNHVVVALVGADVKQVRCTTCEADHEYKHGKIPRQRRKAESPAALYAQVAANAPKHVTAPLPQAPSVTGDEHSADTEVAASEAVDNPSSDHDEHAVDSDVKVALGPEDDRLVDDDEDAGDGRDEEGPVHRPLIRASLPRHEGQPPPARPIPEFTIRQPGGRPGRFRPRQQRGGQQFQGNRANGSGPGGGFSRAGGPRQGGRPPQGAMRSRRHGPGRKRSK